MKDIAAQIQATADQLASLGQQIAAIPAQGASVPTGVLRASMQDEQEAMSHMLEYVKCMNQSHQRVAAELAKLEQNQP